MMIARGQDGENVFLLLGLSAENIRRLQAGKPIRITRQSHGDAVPDELTIGIMAGATEADLAKAIKPLCNDMTQVFKDPRL